MKRKNGFIARQIAGQYMIMAVGDSANELCGYIKINESGMFIWEQLCADTDERTVAEALAQRYGIGYERAENDTRAFLKVLREAGAVTE